jgi:alpha/beta superfamily hydrolase
VAALREIPGAVGPLEVLLDEPATGRGVSSEGLLTHGWPGGLRAAVVLAHPHPQYGGTMHTKTVYQSAKALARIGCAVLRFNFRGVGASAGSFDSGLGEQDDFKAATDFMAGRYPGAALWAAGMSFGSWIGLTRGAADARVSLLLGIAMPVTKYDFSLVAGSAKPKFFIHGEDDEVSSSKALREFYARCSEPKELAIVDAADHLFDGKTGEVADTIEELLLDWPA